MRVSRIDGDVFGKEAAVHAHGERDSLMRAVMITKPGGPEVLTVTDREVRAAGPAEVRIAVKAAAVNPTDIAMRQNDQYAKGTVGIPGMDAAGIVESVGDGVDRLNVGDEVMAVTTPRRPEGGAQIELLVVPAASVVPIPKGATLAQASTLPMNGLTARLALDLLNLSAGQTLAVSGGAGLLAHFAIALARQYGIRVIADAKPSETDLVRSYGADVVVARGDRFSAEVRTEVPGGVDGLLDTALLGRDSFPAIRTGGGYVPVRGWDGSPSEREIRILPVLVVNALARTDWLNEMRDLASSGAITLRVAGEYSPERAADAHRAMEAGGLRGRAVIVF
jgi:NADPH2:quinone reductase